MNIQIYNYLKKYYLKFTNNKFQKLNNKNFNNNHDIFEYFQTIWGKKHGGLFLLNNLFGNYKPPEIMPHKKNNIIFITDTGSTSNEFKKNI